MKLTKIFYTLIIVVTIHSNSLASESKQHHAVVKKSTINYYLNDNYINSKRREDFQKIFRLPFRKILKTISSKIKNSASYKNPSSYVAGLSSNQEFLIYLVDKYGPSIPAINN